MSDFFNSLIYPSVVAVVGCFVSYYFTNKKVRKIRCKEHTIFSRLRAIKEINIEINFKLENKVKEKIFKCILKEQVDCILEEAISLANSCNSIQNMQDSLNESATNIFKNLNNFYKYKESYSECDKKTLSIVMDKFHKVNNNRVQKLYADIYNFDSSAFHDSNDEKIYAFFDALVNLTLDQLTIAEIVFNTINGDLKGLEFKGEIVK